MTNIFERLIVKDRYIKNGKLVPNLLRPSIAFFTRRWGYIDKETTCKFFELVVTLLKDDMKQTESKKAQGKKIVQGTLPSEGKPATANVGDKKSE